jgi:filamentous hemagglutinin family protein
MSCFFNQQQRRTLWVFGSIYLCLLNFTHSAQSQIVPDNTLPNNTVVTPPDGNTSRIEGGTTVGGSLFHSFQEFSIPTGTAAFFNNAPDIQNIFTRVTGGSVSNIDGVISANGTANLFLINPSGIRFGPNAQLNIGGSFVGSTANSLQLSDGSEFSATQPQSPPLLTVSVPIGLQFGANSGAIINESRANNNAGLQVLPGRTLALVGGDINLNGGNLTAPQGQIELGSVASPGLVNLTSTPTGLTFGYQEIQNFGNINLTGAAAVNASGLGGGSIRVRGGQVALNQGSRLVAETFGNFDGRSIDIQAERFSLSERAFVSTSTFGAGTGGDLTVQAQAIEVAGTTPLLTSFQLLSGTFNPLNLSDGLYSFSAGSGAAGRMTLNTEQLRVENGANLFTGALLGGQGGDLTVKVSQLAQLSNGSILFAGTAGSGNAGDITLDIGQLQVLSGTAISTTPGPTSSGQGGNILVTAESAELRGTPAGAFVPGGFFTTTLGAGNAGNLTLTTGQLIVADGMQLSTSSSGFGGGGNLIVNADTIELSGISADGRFLGGLLASTSLLTVPGLRGDARAGDLTVNTRRLSVRGGAQISAATGGSGEAGKLTINASESVEVSGLATGVAPLVEAVSFGPIDGIIPSAIETNTRGAGNAGDLSIRTGRLTVRDGAEIGVRSTSTGSAGNLNVVAANSIQLSQQGTLSAVNLSGRQGGNISIDTSRLIIEDGSSISVSSQAAGTVGNIGIRADSIHLNRGTITATSLLGRQGGDIDLDVNNELVLRNRSQISTEAGTANTGGGNGGNITLDVGVIAAIPREDSDITANAFQGRGGNIKITTQGILGLKVRDERTSLSDITASSTLGINGVIEINQLGVDPTAQLVELPTEFINATQLVATGCAADSGSSFIITGRGGLPDDPTQTLRGRTVWRDLRTVESEGDVPTTSQRSQASTSNSAAAIVEATGWVMDADGRVKLVANQPENTLSKWQQATDCSRFQPTN